MAETTPEQLGAIRARGLPVLRKPVRPAKLRALIEIPRRGLGAC